ncbi:helix-turn-helix transcriptional regulator [Oribacterium sp. HCP28S3_H8]|uniref:helix-turn-helix transcriptional regulator n=1 Tax=Oribacterium sp. HCP28S3_H8 TaxID=3438945 RepID=UPI003F8CB63A
MSDLEYGKIISKNLKRIFYEHQKTQADVAKDLHISKATISSWVNGTRVPRMDKIDLLCHYFNVTRQDIMEHPSDREPNTQAYYLNPETARVAQEIFDDPNKRILFDAAENATPDQLQKAAQYIEFLKWGDADNDDPA